MRERLEAELARATAELKAFMATWEYAFAMAGGCHGGGGPSGALGYSGAYRGARGSLS
jgi:hypothetical protein